MTIEELQEKIRDCFGSKEFTELVRGRYSGSLSFETATGMIFSSVDDYRSEGSGDYDGWDFVFKIDDKFYLTTGYYDSNNGIDLYNGLDFYEVERMTKTEEYWGAV